MAHRVESFPIVFAMINKRIIQRSIKCKDHATAKMAMWANRGKILHTRPLGAFNF